MATILLIFICIIYIGLGIPDSAIGSAWPAIFVDLNLPISNANFVTMLIAIFTATSSFVSAKLINKFGTGLITACSTLLTAFALLGFALSPNMIWLCISSIPAGFGAGCIDAALNNYVALHYKASSMSFLHCFYGIGVAITPFVMSFALRQNSNWRLGYRSIFIIQGVLAFIAFAILPLWNKVKENNEKKENFTPKTLSYREMFRIKAERASWLVFFLATGLEFSCDTWICTYLVKSEGATDYLASFYLTFYYLGITLGRFISGIVSKKMSNKNIIYCGFILMGICVLGLNLPLSYNVKGILFLLLGVGLGPLFPNLTYLTPINFDKEISQSLISSQMVMCNLGILIVPPIFGLIGEYISIKAFPIYLAIIFAVLVCYTFIYFNRVKKSKCN